MTLWIKIDTADTVTRNRATNALKTTGIDHQVFDEDSPEFHETITNTLDRAPRRDPAGIALGAILTLGFGSLAVWLWTLGSWWIIGAVPAALMALFGMVGFAADVQKKDRTDQEGSPHD